MGTVVIVYTHVHAKVAVPLSVMQSLLEVLVIMFEILVHNTYLQSFGASTYQATLT